MMFVFTFILIAGLEIAGANDEQVNKKTKENIEKIEKPDMCVGCDDEKKKKEPETELIIDINIDPVTGNINYIVKDIVIK